MTTPAQGGTDTPDVVFTASGVLGPFTFTRPPLAAMQEETEERQRRAARARALLNFFLTPEQRKSMETNGYVDLVGSEGTHYQVQTGWYEDNVRWIDGKGIGQGGFCCHPRRTSEMSGGSLPREDLILGQILALRTNEKHFLKVAVKTWGSRPPVAPADEREPESARAGTVGRQAVELLDRFIRQAR